MQFRANFLPPMCFQNRCICPRGGVKGDLLPYGLAVLCSLGFSFSNHYESSCHISEISPQSTRCAQSTLNGRLHILAKVLGSMEWVNVQAVANFSRHAAHILVHAGNEYWNFRMGDWTGIEEWGHQ